MKSKRKSARRRLGVLAGGAAAAARAAESAPEPRPKPAGELVELSAAIGDEQRITERQGLIDSHRGQRSELIARQARETAELIARHVDEERALERAQSLDLARQWRREGRELGGWQLRALGNDS